MGILYLAGGLIAALVIETLYYVVKAKRAKKKK